MGEKRKKTTTPKIYEKRRIAIVWVFLTDWAKQVTRILNYITQMFFQTRKYLSRFRGHSQVGSPSASCYSQKSGVESDWED